MSEFKISREFVYYQNNNKRIRKGMYKDLYRHIESNRKMNEICFSSNKNITMTECLKSFGEGFISSFKAIFESPKALVLGGIMIMGEWYFSTKKKMRIFSKLGILAGIAQLSMSLSELKNNGNISKSFYYAGSGASSLSFIKYTNLLNCSTIITEKNS